MSKKKIEIDENRLQRFIRTISRNTEDETLLEKKAKDAKRVMWRDSKDRRAKGDFQ